MPICASSSGLIPGSKGPVTEPFFPVLVLKFAGASISTIYDPGVKSLNRYFPLISVLIKLIETVGAVELYNLTGILLTPVSLLLNKPSLLISFQTKSPID